jgi:hypothetical protein
MSKERVSSFVQDLQESQRKTIARRVVARTIAENDNLPGFARKAS